MLLSRLDDSNQERVVYTSKRKEIYLDEHGTRPGKHLQLL